MRIADLHESQRIVRGGGRDARARRAERAWHASRNCPNDGGAAPCCETAQGLAAGQLVGGIGGVVCAHSSLLVAMAANACTRLYRQERHLFHSYCLLRPVASNGRIYCETSSRASRWTNADNTAGSASDTASQSMLGPLARATLNPRTVRSPDIGTRDVSGRTKTSIMCWR